MDKDPQIFINHIMSGIHDIENYIDGLAIGDFLSTNEKQDAVLRKLEVIGEAVKNLPATFKDQHSSMPWKKIAGMRDVLIHEYFEVDLKLVWMTITIDLPKFKRQIEGLSQ